MLSHQRRRAVLDLLLTHDQLLTVSDIRNEIIEKEQDTEITEIPSEQVKQVHISLHHVHIPKLAEEGVISYDPNRNLVEPTETCALHCWMSKQTIFRVRNVPTTSVVEQGIEDCSIY
ncbi:DUF7344 domain-containing protein [Natrinema versiforme]